MSNRGWSINQEIKTGPLIPSQKASMFPTWKVSEVKAETVGENQFKMRTVTSVHAYMLTGVTTLSPLYTCSNLMVLG